jgi:glycosyltransferase involved in cell wall biosynthesis
MIEAESRGTPVKRVLVLAPTPFFGDRGCHVRIYEEVRALARRGIQAEIVTYQAGRDLPDVVIRRAPRLPGLRPRALGPGYSRPALDAVLVSTSYRAVRRFRPQVIHAHLHEGIVVGAALRMLTGIPLVADLQGSLTEELIDHDFLHPSGTLVRIMRRFERWLVNQPDALVSSSAAGATLLTAQGVDPVRVESLPDGADLEHFRPLQPDPALVRHFGLEGKQVVAFLGVLTEYQGVDALLAAVPAVIARVPRTHFVIMGYPNEERYRARVREAGLAAHVSLPGRIAYDDAARHLALGTMAVSAKQSLTEANGKLLNYMACALPVVATDTPVNREILGELGVYAPVGDHAALAEAIVSLLGDGQRRQSLGVALRQRAETLFSWPSLTDRLVRVYEKVTRSSARGAYAAQL